jgi:hypothetical protein
LNIFLLPWRRLRTLERYSKFTNDVYQVSFHAKVWSDLLDIRVAKWFIFKPKIPIWVNFEVLRLENVIYFMAIWNIFMDVWDILWPLGTFCVNLVHYSRFWYHVPKKSGIPIWHSFHSKTSTQRQTRPLKPIAHGTPKKCSSTF